MGGCMSFQRFVHRNQLIGDYGAGYGKPNSGEWAPRALLAGDLRRIERDQRDERHLKRYAAAVGITPAQVKAVLDKFLDEDCEGALY